MQQRIKNDELGILKDEQENELPNFPSFIPFLPPLVSFLINYCFTLNFHLNQECVSR